MKKEIMAVVMLAVLTFSGCGKAADKTPASQTDATSSAAETVTAAPATTVFDRTAVSATSAPPVSTTVKTTTAKTTTSTKKTTVKADSESKLLESSSSITKKFPEYAEMESIVKAFPRECSVLVYSIDGTVLYSYNADKKMSGASLIKLSYIYYCCKQLDKGVHSLDKTMTFTASRWYHDGSGIINYSGDNKQYTVRQLIDYALRYSDNVAYDMLLYLFGIDGYNKMIRDWGYDVQLTDLIHFPEMNADFVKTSFIKMQKMSNTGESWKIAWNALNNSTDCYIRDAIGVSNDIAVKYGNVSRYYHEACYVDGKYPYIVVVMSGTVRYIPTVDLVQQVGDCARRLAERYFTEKYGEIQTTTQKPKVTTTQKPTITTTQKPTVTTTKKPTVTTTQKPTVTTTKKPTVTTTQKPTVTTTKKPTVTTTKKLTVTTTQKPTVTTTTALSETVQTEISTDGADGSQTE